MYDHPAETPHVSLCTGYAGIDLGLKRACPSIRTVAYVEREAYACANLVAKIEEGRLDWAPIFTDIASFPWREFRPLMGRGILSFGWPCQPVSCAGQRKATKDERWLFDIIADGIAVMRPGVLFAENVEGLLSAKMPDGSSVLAHCVTRLESLHYRVEIGIFSAEECGAPHRRKRVFILGVLADSNGVQPELSAWLRPECGGESGRRPHDQPAGSSQRLADARRGLGSGRGGGGDVACPAGALEGDWPERQRLRDAARDGGADVAEPARIGRGEGRPESGGEQGRRDAAERGLPVDRDADGRTAEGRAKRLEQNCERWARIRREVLSRYSNGNICCACCGENRYEFLALDHIDGGGSEARRKFGSKGRWRQLQKDGYPPGHRVLCHNCNQSRFIFGVCPHERERQPGDDALGDANGAGCEQQRRPEPIRAQQPSAERAGGSVRRDVGDAEGERSGASGTANLESQRTDWARRGSDDLRLPRFPPGPGLGGAGVLDDIRELYVKDPAGAWARYGAELANTLRWGAILAVRPDLAPAVKPTLRGVADGLPGELVSTRVDELRIGGNGVVIATVERAFRVLAERFGGG